MDVDDALGILRYIYRSDEAEVASSDDEIHLLSLHESNRFGTITELLVREVMTRDIELLGTLNNASLRAIGNDQSHLCFACLAKITNDLLGIGAIARG